MKSFVIRSCGRKLLVRSLLSRSLLTHPLLTRSLLTRPGPRVAFCIATSLLLLAGCGSSGGSGSSGPSKPKNGGTLQVGLVTPGSFDPALASTVSERVLADALYDGLTAWDSQTLSATPALAERWVVSSDQKHWTFRLKEKTVAANGDVITATDVKSTFERIASPAEKSPVRDLLSPIVGYDAMANDSSSTLSGVVVLDQNSVRIDLTSPQQDLPKLLGNPSFGIAHFIAGGDFISTGSYAMIGKTETLVTLRKVPGRTPHLEFIDIHLYKDVDTAYSAMTADKLDWTPVPPERADEAGKKYGTKLFRSSLRTLYLSFNLKDPRFADQRFREAIVHAIDRESVAKSISPNSSVLNTVVADGVTGSQGDACGTTCSYDVTKAKSLLKDVFGGTAPPAVIIDISSGPPFTNLGVQTLVGNLQAAGISVQIRPTPADQFGTVTVQPDRQIFQTSWSAAYPSPDAFLVPLFQSQSTSNVTGFNNGKVDQEIADAQAESTQSQRVVDWQNIERQVMGTVPVIPIAQFPVDSVATAHVRNLIVLPTGNFDTSQVWLA